VNINNVMTHSFESSTIIFSSVEGPDHDGSTLAGQTPYIMSQEAKRERGWAMAPQSPL
jgi:hypothetical protein